MSADAGAAAAKAAADAAAATAAAGTNANADAAAAKTAADAAAAKGAADTKTAAETKAAADKAAADVKGAGAPKEYAAFKLPEGVKLEGETLKEFTAFAQKLGLSQEAAQAFVEREIGLQKSGNDAAVAQVKQQGEQWEAAARADAEIGGAKYDENLGVAKAVLESKLVTPELKAMLENTPMGKNPDVLKFLVKVGRAIGQDGLVQGGASDKPDPLRAMYPTMYK